MSFADSTLFFDIKPVTPWTFYLKYARSATDSAQINELINAYSQPFKWYFATQQPVQIDSVEFNSYYSAFNRISLSEAYNFVREIPLEDLGLNIMKIFPKSAKDYINETIYLKNDSKISRKAVVEQIIAKRSKVEIRELLSKMDNYANSLKGDEKLAYETYSVETYEQIQALL